MKKLISLTLLLFSMLLFSQIKVKATLPGLPNLPKLEVSKTFSTESKIYDLDKKIPKTRLEQIGKSNITTSTAIYKAESYPVYSTNKGKIFIVYPNKQQTGYNKKYIK